MNKNILLEARTGEKVKIPRKAFDILNENLPDWYFNDKDSILFSYKDKSVFADIIKDKSGHLRITSAVILYAEDEKDNQYEIELKKQIDKLNKKLSVG
jgi:hypothetical protein